MSTTTQTTEKKDIQTNPQEQTSAPAGQSLSNQAIELAKEKARAQEQVSGNDLLQLVTFVVGTEEFAVPILSVQEINRMMQITRVPQSPRFVEGVINLRGRIIPVIDLRLRFGLQSQTHTNEHRIIVIEINERTLGFVVDRVHEVLRINRSIVEPAPRMVTSIESEYIEGIAKLDDRLLILLDMTRLFSNNQLTEIDHKTSHLSE